MAEHIMVELWIDDGETDGWQGCWDESGPLTVGDPGEGNNIWDYDEEIIFTGGTMAELYNAQINGWYGHYFMQGCTVYYIGWRWWIPPEVCNVIQGDLFKFDMEFYVEQHRNNPDPQCPGTDGMEPCRCLQTLKASVLDGQAQDDADDFKIYLDGQFVGEYIATVADTNEIWIDHVWDVSHLELPCCETHTVEIVCTAGQAWSGFNSWGQLAVDYVALYCDCGLCDEVDIGLPSSETGHNLVGWGPIMGADGNGYYGGIQNCRCTWFNNDPNTLDGREATVDLTCDCSYPPYHE